MKLNKPAIYTLQSFDSYTSLKLDHLLFNSEKSKNELMLIFNKKVQSAYLRLICNVGYYFIHLYYVTENKHAMFMREPY